MCTRHHVQSAISAEKKNLSSVDTTDDYQKDWVCETLGVYFWQYMILLTGSPSNCLRGKCLRYHMYDNPGFVVF